MVRTKEVDMRKIGMVDRKHTFKLQLLLGSGSRPAEHLCRNRPHGQKSAINTYLSKEPFAKGDDHRLFGDSVEMGDVVTSGTCQAALEQTNKPADSDIVLHQTARRKNNAVPSDCGWIAKIVVST